MAFSDVQPVRMQQLCESRDFQRARGYFLREKNDLLQGCVDLTSKQQLPATSSKHPVAFSLHDINTRQKLKPQKPLHTLLMFKKIYITTV